MIGVETEFILRLIREIQRSPNGTIISTRDLVRSIRYSYSLDEAMLEEIHDELMLAIEVGGITLEMVPPKEGDYRLSRDGDIKPWDIDYKIRNKPYEKKPVERILIETRYNSFYEPEDWYKDKLEITKDQIRYECTSLVKTEKRSEWSWSYQTDSKDHQSGFKKLEDRLRVVFDNIDYYQYNDVGLTQFLIQYEDGTFKEKWFYGVSEGLFSFFRAVKRMLPVKNGYMPQVMKRFGLVPEQSQGPEVL